MDDSTVEVNLLKGKVEVSMQNNENPSTLTLMPNEKIIYNKANGAMFTYRVDAAKSAQWTIGKICFVDASLEKIAKDLEQKFDVKIKLETKSINN